MKKTLLALVALLLPCAALAANTFTLSTSSGYAPLTVRVTWNVDNATSCTASGLWTGAKPASGTADVIVNATGNLVLNCITQTPNGPGTAVLTWTAPTQNTDGSAYTNAGGYWVYRGASSSSLAKAVQITNPATLTYTDNNVPAGQTTFWALSAYNSGGTESALTPPGSKTIPATTAGAFTDTKAVTILPPPVPKAPTDFTVQ